MQTILGKHWHHLPGNEVVGLLDTDAEKGLDIFEVKHRQDRFGANVITPRQRKSALMRLLTQFHNPLIYILIISSVITAVVKQELVDAAIIFAVVLVNAVIGFVQEARAESAIEALAKSLISEANVLRSGKQQRVSAEELVPGDVVILNAGDKVPADLRLLQSKDLQVVEASLTGESAPVAKLANRQLPVDTILAERTNMAYTSTLVTYGQSKGVVIATGDHTEIGRISTLISSAAELATPLTRKMADFSRVIMYGILGLAVVTLAIGLLRNQPFVDTFTAAVALAVAAIPEGLPAALTVTLAIGVSRMARRKAIIRKLPAVEALGSVTVICSDKTGTLTKNQMTVQEIAVPGRSYQITGIGLSLDGEVYADGKTVENPLPMALQETLIAGMLCNDSELGEAEDGLEAVGDPTEVALVVSAKKAGLEADIRKRLPRLDVLPFDSQRQYMASLHDVGPREKRLAYVKGAAEVLLERCERMLNIDGEARSIDIEAIQKQVEQMASKGLRVLAMARRELPADASGLTDRDLSSGLTFLGLQGMIDPPRPEAIEAVKACQEAGIRVKMITGDHAMTATAIARQFNLIMDVEPPDSAQVMTGKALAEVSDEELIDIVQKVNVFARVTPEQKLRLVEALQARNEIVAMTGDGVNDGPALKKSDIGVAMGISGTEVAKEAADMVLTDDNFATIEAAVEEGRGVFDNLTKIISWVLPTNLGEGLIILVAILAGVTLPILPVQILWINMVTVAVLGLVLALEKKEGDIMKRQPRDPQASILNPVLLWRIAIVGILILVAAFGLYEWEILKGASIAEARTVAVNVVIVVEIFYLFNARSLTQSPFRIGFFSNPWAIWLVIVMIGLQILFTYLPWMNVVFHSAPIPLMMWVDATAIGLFGFAVIEVEKWLRRRKARFSLGLSNL